MRSEQRNRQLLWEGLRLAVVDVETVWDEGGFSGLARDEADRAIERVLAERLPVRLAPQPRAVRRQQHATVEVAGLTSVSHGEDPRRAVEVRPRPAGEVAPAPPISAGGEHRAAWVAVVECERGRPGGTWHSLVNPGVPVDPITFRSHRLTDQQLAASPPFARIAPDLLRLLTPAAGETLVLVGHNIGFDLGVLRAEMRRAGLRLPDLPVLDTMGPLATRAGKAAGRSLADLLSDLGLRNDRPHRADSDAQATASAACALLDLAAARGHYDLATLLADLGSHTTISFPTNRPGRAAKPVRAARPIPVEHAAKHEPPGQPEMRRWIAVADECARLRCPELAGDPVSSVAVALASRDGNPGVAPAILLEALAEVVERRAGQGDGPGAATALDGVGLVFDLCCPVPLAEGRYPFERQETIALWHRLRAATDPLPRCQPDYACPRCWEGQPCGRDELVRRIAPGAGNWRWHNGKLETGYSINHWLAARGDQGWFVHRHNRARRGGRVRGAFAGPELADAVLGWLLRTYRAHGEDTEPAKVVAHQINRVIEAGGCGDPWFWEMVALEWARPGREADLVAAIDACENGLRQCPEGTTASAWTALRTTCEMLRLRLLAVQRGHEIRHHPGPRAKRTRPLRFA